MCFQFPFIAVHDSTANSVSISRLESIFWLIFTFDSSSLLEIARYCNFHLPFSDWFSPSIRVPSNSMLICLLVFIFRFACSWFFWFNRSFLLQFTDSFSISLLMFNSKISIDRNFQSMNLWTSCWVCYCSCNCDYSSFCDFFPDSIW